MQHILQKFSITLLLSCSLSLVAMDNHKQLTMGGEKNTMDPLMQSMMFDTRVKRTNENVDEVENLLQKHEDKIKHDMVMFELLKVKKAKEIEELKKNLLEVEIKIQEKQGHSKQNCDKIIEKAQLAMNALLNEDMENKESLENEVFQTREETKQEIERAKKLQDDKKEIVKKLIKLGAELPKRKIKTEKKGYIWNSEIEIELPIVTNEELQKIKEEMNPKNEIKEEVIQNLSDLNIEEKKEEIKEVKNEGGFFYNLITLKFIRGAAKQEEIKNIDLKENKDQNLQEVVQQEEKKEEATLNEVVKNEEEIKIETTEINN